MTATSEDPAPLSRQLEALDDAVGVALDRFGLAACLLDRNGTIRWLSRRATDLVGEAVGKRFTSVLAPEQVHAVRSGFARSMLGPRDTEAACVVVVSRHGRRVPLQLTSAPLCDGQTVVGLFALGREGRQPEVASPREHATRQVPDALTPRQQEVLVLLADGLGTRDLARQLGITEETVRNHIRALLRKLGAHSRLEAVVVAARMGLL